MKEEKTPETTDILEREREREQYFRKIGFICYAKINCKAHKKSSKNLAKIEYKVKKWVDYEKQEKARNSLPFYIL